MTQLGGDRKEPCEILEAYDNTYLDLSGNSTHLAPWHAKLGFVKDPFIATLDSLTPDGGRVPAMDLIVTKVMFGASTFGQALGLTSSRHTL